MQGVFVGGKRPKFKKNLKEAVAEQPEKVAIEATSMFGNEYGGLLEKAPVGTYYIVGPDPHRKRNWYAQLIVSDGGEFTVK